MCTDLALRSPQTIAICEKRPIPLDKLRQGRLSLSYPVLSRVEEQMVQRLTDLQADILAALSAQVAVDGVNFQELAEHAGAG